MTKEEFYRLRNTASSDQEAIYVYKAYLEYLETQSNTKDEYISKLKQLINDFNNTYNYGDFDFKSFGLHF